MPPRDRQKLPLTSCDKASPHSGSPSPRNETASGFVPRIDVGEHRGLGIDCDGQLQGGVAFLFLHRSAIDPPGQQSAWQAKRFKTAALLRFGGQPWRRG